MRKNNTSPIVNFSLSEISFILLFISIAASVLLFGQWIKSTKEIENLEKEIVYLQTIIAEKRDAVTPCWKRPDSIIPPIAIEIIIENATSIKIIHYKYGEILLDNLSSNPEKDHRKIVKNLNQILSEDLEYANKRRCYIRGKIKNNTNNFNLYKRIADCYLVAEVVLING